MGLELGDVASPVRPHPFLVDLQEVKDAVANIKTKRIATFFMYLILLFFNGHMLFTINHSLK